jgi:hypothetical protein
MEGVRRFFYARYEVGDGSKVWFWHGVWCKDLPLKFSFLKLFTVRMHG